MSQLRPDLALKEIAMRQAGSDVKESMFACQELTNGFKDLKKLGNGWFNGDGTAFNEHDLDRLYRLLEIYYPKNLPTPSVSPTPDGNVRLSWMLGRNDASLEVNLTEFTGFWHNLNLDTQKDESDDIALNKLESWNLVVAKLTELCKATGNLKALPPHPFNKCVCRKCGPPWRKESQVAPPVDSIEYAFEWSNYMALCPRCGNKRCPGAEDHDNVELMCKNSNEPGQKGSSWENVN